MHLDVGGGMEQEKIIPKFMMSLAKKSHSFFVDLKKKTIKLITN